MGTGFPDPNDVSVILSAISVPNIFDDDRDAILAKFNKMQAFLGVGQGYFNTTALPINFSMENPFCRFKVRRFLNYSLIKYVYQPKKLCDEMSF